MKYSISDRARAGFTIVELLIVIVVIAILATVAIVAYNGISQRAKQSAAQSAAQQVAKKVASYAITNTELYPSTLADIGIADEGDTAYQYSVNNNVTPRTFCATVTVSNVSYFVSNSQPNPASGGCAGHGQGGQSAVTNLSYASRIISRGTVTGYSKSNIVWNGESWDAQVTASVVSHGLRASFEMSPQEATGSYYTGSIEVGNPNTVAIDISVDIGDVQLASQTIPAGQKRVLSIAGTRAWTTTYRFLDINAESSAVNRSFVIRYPTVIHGNLGTISTYSGDSPNWVWNGAVKASSSTGPMI